MKKIVYKNILFEDYKLYAEADNSSGCVYDYPETAQSLDGYQEVHIYICPKCIRKHGLYEECETTTEETLCEIEEYPGVTCGVAGCSGGFTFEAQIPADKCRLIL